MFIAYERKEALKFIGLIIGFLFLATFLICLEADPAEANDDVSQVEIINCCWLACRGGPGMEFDVVNYVKKGQFVEVMDEQGDWLKTSKGFIYDYYTEPSNGDEKAIKNQELYWLARLVEAEAGSQPFEGKVAVANVVLNRLKSNWFPDSVKGVIFQYVNGVPQFSPVANGSIYREPTKDSIKAAKEALKGRLVISNKVLYFYNPVLVGSNNWIRTRDIEKRIGGHVFAA